MFDYSDDSLSAQIDAERERNAITGEGCEDCFGPVAEGERYCEFCTADETADITHEIMEALNAA